MAWPAAEQVGGYLTYDATLPQGWAVREYLKQLNAPLPLWNTAKQKLLENKQIFSHTIGRFDPDAYCQYAPHYDYTFFEMQHSTMTWGDIERMIAACPRAGMPMIRVPDEFESTLQKATDMRAIGILSPLLTPSKRPRQLSRYARFPPEGGRSEGAGQGASPFLGSQWHRLPEDGQREHAHRDDDRNADRRRERVQDIARIAGVDGLLVANTDLGNFSGFAPQSPQYEALVSMANSRLTLKAGKFLGTVTTALRAAGRRAGPRRSHRFQAEL